MSSRAESACVARQAPLQGTLAAQVAALVSQADALKAELLALQATPRQVGHAFPGCLPHSWPECSASVPCL